MRVCLVIHATDWATAVVGIDMRRAVTVFPVSVHFHVPLAHVWGFCAQALADEWSGDAEGKQRRLAAVKASPYTFRSYDPAVTQLYAERYPWVAAANRVVVCTRRTAMSMELAHLMKRLMTTGK